MADISLVLGQCRSRSCPSMLYVSTPLRTLKTVCPYAYRHQHSSQHYIANCNVHQQQIPGSFTSNRSPQTHSSHACSGCHEIASNTSKCCMHISITQPHREAQYTSPFGCSVYIINSKRRSTFQSFLFFSIADAKFVNAMQLQHTQAVGQEHQHQRLRLPTAMAQGLHN